ncbi:hypothetical protein PI124_g18881 [Phytophthora idaei]|nr:hypothetical protein PI125_g19817 [Phytophthora idaei]KAG3148673.1 hypothetical protein PI126_g12360 [Phytophthora idaei]KAG3236103.1 hypothetical protein PI124_g18881 [Phytophthora idaei]
MAVADTREGRGTKRSQSETSVQTESKKIGRPSHGGCDKQAQFKGLCAGHGGRRICSRPGCEKKVASKGKCGDHGGGRPGSYQKRHKSTRSAADKRNQQEDSTFSLLASTAAVMPPASFADSHGSMVSLLLGESFLAMAGTAMPIATSGESAGQNPQRTASDIISEALV